MKTLYLLSLLFSSLEAINIKNYFKDVLISNELRLKILKEKNISALNYNIETVNQVVYIMGIATDNAELALVIDQARNIRGVQKVLSYVVLKNDERRLFEIHRIKTDVSIAEMIAEKK